MRMRRKAHLEQRLDRCVESGKLIILNCEDRNFVTSLEKKEYLDLAGIFKNDNPVVLEIGAGKGQFACELALRNPDINVLAVEMTSNVIVDAAEKAMAKDIPNLVFLRCDARYLEKFIPDGSVTRLYLNFSCPYPKRDMPLTASRIKTFSGYMKSSSPTERRYIKRRITDSFSSSR